MSKQFTGIWLDVSLLNDDRLTLTEKLLLAYTRSFAGPCIASDDHIAGKLGVSPKTIANCLSSLRKKGIISGRDFPKSGTQLPENGNETSRKREHRSKGEQSIDEMKKKAGSALGFSPEKPEDLAVLLSLLAARGIGELDARREVGAVMAEIAAGVMAPPGHWPAYVESRIRRAKARAAREAKAAKAYTPPPPVSQFGRTYT